MKFNVTYLAAFLEGIASFITSCVLALIPTYISYLAGTTIEEIENNKHNKKTLMMNAIGFVFGIFIVFALLGATATTFGRVLNMSASLLQKISGIIIIIFGIFHMGIINPSFMNREKRITIKKVVPTLGGSILFGMSFAFGWTPCIGPALGSVLMMAANTKTLWNAILLLSVYTLGLGIPLLLIAFFIEKMIISIRKIYKYFDLIKKISGVLLIIIGMLIFFDKLIYLSV